LTFKKINLDFLCKVPYNIYLNSEEET